MSQDRQTHAFSPHCSAGNWKLSELVAMLVGFVFFWPIGLAVVLWKMWQKKQGYGGDIFAFLREQTEAVRRGWNFEDRAPRYYSSGTSGNVAFDEWREAELARLEEERRKLAEAERDFARHIEELRRARDREEFESFMRNRRGGA